MSAILSAISGQFTKSLILGMFFPALLFVLAGTAALQSFVTFPLSFLEPLQSLDKEWRVLAISFTTIVITGLLYTLNVPILRLYEGYPWEDSIPGQLLCALHKRRLEQLTRDIPRLRLIRDRWKDINQGRREIQRAQSLLGDYSRRLSDAYPNNIDLLLPTAFGNVIRAFEYYPQQQYGMSAIAFWPRLVAVAEKDYLATVDESKIAVDFFVNASFLAALLAVVITLTGEYATIVRSDPDALPWWPWQAFFAILASVLFYRSAVGSARNWGATVKGAFDLYRSKLLERLGYTAELSTREKERELWGKISQQVVFGDPPFSTPMPYKTVAAPTPEIQLITEPSGIQLQALKSALSVDFRRMRFQIRLRNSDPANRNAVRLQLMEKLPPGLVLEAGSLRLNQAAFQNVSGSNTLSFDLGPLPAGRELILEYSALRYKRE